MFGFLFRTRKFKIAQFSDHYQLYVKLLRFGKYEPIKSAKVVFDSHDLDSQIEALQKIKEMKTRLMAKNKPLFIED